MKLNIKNSLLFFVILLFAHSILKAQAPASFSLQQLIDTALKSNRLLSIKNWQVKEKASKLKEDEIKKYPSAQLDGGYQYNFNLPEFTIPAGSIGIIPGGTNGDVLLPGESKNLKLGEKSTYNAGISFYQPLTQQVKINTGLAIDKTDIKLAEKEKEKLSLQLQQGVEKLYYGILITQKQTGEAQTKLELARCKLNDMQHALQAGETITANIAGLQASVAEEEENLLKLHIQLQDYISDLINITNIKADTLVVEPVEPLANPMQQLTVYQNAIPYNPDIQIAGLNREKALLGIKAATQNNLPDIGLVAGYYIQQGNPLMASSSPYIGISFKWNLQDIFSNKAVMQQRQFQLRQAEENSVYIRQQLTGDIEKAWRKASQAASLIKAAQTAVTYRQKAIKVQEDKQAAGLDYKTSLLEAKSLLARSEVDLYSAQLSYLLAVSELNYLTGMPYGKK